VSARDQHCSTSVVTLAHPPLLRKHTSVYYFTLRYTPGAVGLGKTLSRSYELSIWPK
jgi:hypothetical protein